MDVTLSPQGEELLKTELARYPEQSPTEILDRALRKLVSDEQERIDAPQPDESTGSPLVWEDGLLVHTGKAAKSFDWDRFIEDEREQRIREIAGL